MRLFLFSTGSLEAPYFETLTRGLVERGIRVDCGSLQPAAGPSWLRAAGVDSYSSTRARSRLEYPLAVIRLARRLRQDPPDVLHAHLFDGGLVGVVAGRLAQVPVVLLGRHHLDEAWMLGARLHVALDRWMARRADAVSVVSRAVKVHMVEREGIAGDKIEAIQIGFDFARLSPAAADRSRARRELGGSSSYLIGCIGRLYRNKGHRFLLEAAGSLRHEIEGLRLVLVGPGDRGPIEKLARANGVSDRVYFAGYRADIPACIAAMDVVVHPSLSEAFSQVIVETMAVGTPLVATDVGGAAEVIRQGENGLLVSPSSAEAIREAVLLLHRDPSRAKRMALAGRDHVRREFPAERMLEEHVRFYERALEMCSRRQS